MTVPDELVQAAAEAIFEVLFTGEDASEVLAAAALQAVFAKLPECEAVRDVIRDAIAPLLPVEDEYGEISVPEIYDDNDMAVRHEDVALVALAREFGGQDG